MPLPICQCNAGLPIQQQLANIYCALYTLSQGGGVTFPITIPEGGTGAITAIGALNALTTEGTAIASGATVNLNVSTGYFLHITGTASISAFTLTDGNIRVLVFDGGLQLQAGANLILPSGNIVTQAGDTAIVIGEGGGVTRLVSYQRASGTALANFFDQSLNTTDSVSFAGLTFTTINGTPPAPNGTYAVPTSITIVNGVITAIS
jgi:hypothetical protein